jgi:hypothetical protein
MHHPSSAAPVLAAAKHQGHGVLRHHLPRLTVLGTPAAQAPALAVGHGSDVCMDSMRWLLFRRMIFFLACCCIHSTALAGEAVTEFGVAARRSSVMRFICGASTGCAIACRKKRCKPTAGSYRLGRPISDGTLHVVVSLAVSLSRWESSTTAYCCSEGTSKRAFLCATNVQVCPVRLVRLPEALWQIARAWFCVSTQPALATPAR